MSALSAVKNAKECLAAPGEMRVLKIHQFVEDFDAHDDELQDELAAEFRAAFDTCLRSLQSEFGSARLMDVGDESEGEDAIELAFSLVPGPVRLALWELPAGVLYVAVSHQDREEPIVLLIGTADKPSGALRRLAKSRARKRRR